MSSSKMMSASYPAPADGQAGGASSSASASSSSSPSPSSMSASFPAPTDEPAGDDPGQQQQQQQQQARQVMQLRAKLKVLKDAYRELDAENRALSTDRQTLQGRIAELERALAAAEGGRASDGERFEVLRRDRAMLQREAAEARRERDELAAALAERSAQMASLQAAHQRMAETELSLRQQLEDAGITPALTRSRKDLHRDEAFRAKFHLPASEFCIAGGYSCFLGIRHGLMYITPTTIGFGHGQPMAPGDPHEDADADDDEQHAAGAVGEAGGSEGSGDSGGNGGSGSGAPGTSSASALGVANSSARFALLLDDVTNARRSRGSRLVPGGGSSIAVEMSDGRSFTFRGVVNAADAFSNLCNQGTRFAKQWASASASDAVMHQQQAIHPNGTAADGDDLESPPGE